MKNLRVELQELKEELNLVEKVYCRRKEEKSFREILGRGGKLPEDVEEDGVGFYRYLKNDLTEDELNEYLSLRRLAYLKSIRNSIIFVGLLAIALLILSVSAKVTVAIG